ncbi:TetR/AcrR family transcriptional regulator [Vibrio hepatarius]|uniref:TetR/AcrR family transcriptional regulator n=1 Tax=Vibrio hepatarius TaxID=171383 RepID=UPI00142E5169|nr:TetR/AcrR family transcriptional regulator [Vibrio hepatarius]NIY82574.1 TetR/AcrR family transcriptional regulator [Vibrio hepatarius]
MRSAEFDRQYVLRSAMTMFVDKGYGKTSMQDLKRATGLHPGSIYCAFENKRGLLIAALEQYQLDQTDWFHQIFDKHETVFEGFKDYMEHVLEECEREEIQDCLLQKAMNELSRQDDEVESLISDMLNNWHQMLTDKIQLMLNSEEIAPNRDARQLAEFLVMGIYGMRTMSHTNPEPGVLRNLSNQLVAYVAG